MLFGDSIVNYEHNPESEKNYVIMHHEKAEMDGERDLQLNIHKYQAE